MHDHSKIPLLLRCPKCGLGLARAAGTLTCAAGHCYDIAKEGYVNLLLAHQKASGSPGDTREMLLSRRAFLEAGHYALLSDRINALAAKSLGSTKSRRTIVLDTGCGEGYYLSRLARHLDADGCGLDISREAVRLASARDKSATYVAASALRVLPFPDRAFDVLLTVFAPRNPLEFRRILRAGGVWLAAVPADGHLAQLQAALGLAGLKGSKEEQFIDSLDGQFMLAATENLRYRRCLSADDVRHLVQMTPTFWHLPAVERTQLSLPGLEVEFAFTLLALCPRTDSGDREK